jgi:hypothetical protein
MPGLSFSLSLIRRTLPVYGSGSPASSLSLFLYHTSCFSCKGRLLYGTVADIPTTTMGLTEHSEQHLSLPLFMFKQQEWMAIRGQDG